MSFSAGSASSFVPFSQSQLGLPYRVPLSDLSFQLIIKGQVSLFVFPSPEDAPGAMKYKKGLRLTLSLSFRILIVKRPVADLSLSSKVWCFFFPLPRV